VTSQYVVAKLATKTGAEIYVWRFSWGGNKGARFNFVSKIDRAWRSASKDYAQSIAANCGGYIKEI
jgi:hypothetical protein